MLETALVNDFEVQALQRKNNAKAFIGKIFEYRLRILLLLSLSLGLIFGAVFADEADSKLMESLHFLFSTDFTAKVGQGLAFTFFSSFSASCIFLIAVFLLGLSLWGAFIQPLVIFFKGFGIGISASFLLHTYNGVGVLFYLCVLLPSAFISVLALITLQESAFKLSLNLLKGLYKKDGMPHTIVISRFKIFIKKCVHSLILTLLSAAIDTLLTATVAGLFDF